MQHAERLTLAEMREFLAASNTLSFAGAGRRQIYGLVERTLRAQQYLRLSKKDKGVVRRYLAKISGRSLPQITRLIRQYRHSGAVRVSPPQRRRFPRRYTPNDIALLAARSTPPTKGSRGRRCVTSCGGNTPFTTRPPING